MQDGNKSRSKCGVMLARLWAGAVLCNRLCCAGDESSVGRSVDSLFWRAGVVRLFFFSFLPLAFPLSRPAQDPREKQDCAVSVGLHRGKLLSGSGSSLS